VQGQRGTQDGHRHLDEDCHADGDELGEPRQRRGHVEPRIYEDQRRGDRGGQGAPPVAALMAEGRSNADIATALVVSDSARHISSIFAKLDLSPADGDRRVLAVLHFLDSS
jgi:hypothetical protein